jgi:hypothetical protein
MDYLTEEYEMRSIATAMLVFMTIAALAPDTASARLFRRNRSYSRRSTSTTTTATTSTQSSTSISAEQVSTAQGVAVIMAKLGRVGHFGGNPGYEGCGCGSTPQAAYSACCYSNSGMATVDVGYAQSSNGMWYCCRRYR